MVQDSLFLCGRAKPVAVVAMAHSSQRRHKNKNKEPEQKNIIQKTITSTKQFISQAVTVFDENRKQFLNTTAARLLSITLLYPIDAFKTRVQISTRTNHVSLNAIPSTKFGGIFASLLGHLPHTAITFTLFTVFQNHFNNNKDNHRGIRVNTIISACLADSIASIWLAPHELLKVRVQSGMRQNVISAFKQGNLLNGLKSQVLKDVSYRSLYLVLFCNVYDKLMTKNSKYNPNNKAASIALSSAVAGGISAISTPFDVVRSRMMGQYIHSGSQLYKNWVHCMYHSIKHEGIQGVYRGVLPRTVYMASSVALFMFTCDQLNALSKKNQSQGKYARACAKK